MHFIIALTKPFGEFQQQLVTPGLSLQRMHYHSWIFPSPWVSPVFTKKKGFQMKMWHFFHKLKNGFQKQSQLNWSNWWHVVADFSQYMSLFRKEKQATQLEMSMPPSQTPPSEQPPHLVPLSNSGSPGRPISHTAIVGRSEAELLPSKKVSRFFPLLATPSR